MCEAADFNRDFGELSSQAAKKHTKHNDKWQMENDEWKIAQ
jgi:hypothetical protein